MKKYRVFLSRHYIAVAHFDIEAPNEIKAKNAAVKAAYKLIPDARAVACDNTWIPDDPVELNRIGEYGSELQFTAKTVEVDGLEFKDGRKVFKLLD